MAETYHDRMMRPQTPRQYFVREGNRLIPIPTGPATPTMTAQPQSSAEDEGADAPSEGQ